MPEEGANAVPGTANAVISDSTRRHASLVSAVSPLVPDRTPSETVEITEEGMAEAADGEAASNDVNVVVTLSELHFVKEEAGQDDDEHCVTPPLKDTSFERCRNAQRVRGGRC